MNFKDRVKEYLNEEEEINEGIKWFKTSDKLNRAIKKLEKKVTPEMESTITKLKDVALKFKSIEDKYADDKSVGKDEYNSLKVKYKMLLDEITKENVAKAFGVAGVSGIVLGLVAFLGYSKFMNSQEQAGEMKLSQVRSEIDKQDYAKKEAANKEAEIIKTKAALRGEKTSVVEEFDEVGAGFKTEKNEYTDRQFPGEGKEGFVAARNAGDNKINLGLLAAILAGGSGVFALVTKLLQSKKSPFSSRIKSLMDKLEK